jgi:periplasmic protein TonB
MKKIIALLILFYSISNFSQSIEKQNDNLIYDITGIDIKPEFPEGLEKLNYYINENLLKVGLVNETKAKAKTKIHTMFVVEKDGSLSDIKILGRVDTHTAEELIRILKSLPKWSPGKQHGIAVRVLFPLIVFGN